MEKPLKYKEIILRPVLTEKAMALSEEGKDPKTYVFVVDKKANKIQIREAIEKRFGVTVQSVRTLIMPSKKKYLYTRTGVIVGKRLRAYKKAYVTLKPGETIDLFENV